jgi:hypothetical protein
MIFSLDARDRPRFPGFRPHHFRAPIAQENLLTSHCLCVRFLGWRTAETAIEGKFLSGWQEIRAAGESAVDRAKPSPSGSGPIAGTAAPELPL